MPTFKQILDKRFGGLLDYGCHIASENEVCALELLSAKKGIPFSDDPTDVRCFDFRAINDIKVSAKLRTKWMLRMLEAYEDSLDWDKARQKKVLERIFISTVNQLVAALPGLPGVVVNQCEAAKTFEEADIAAVSANCFIDTSIASIASASACEASTYLAEIVGEFVSNEYDLDHNDRIKFFTKACNIWLEAAKD